MRDDVLLKTSTLTAEEPEVMHGHVMKGVDIISRSKWLRSARSVVEFHHEKFDGSGYPKGLRGAEIPLAAFMAMAPALHREVASASAAAAEEVLKDAVRRRFALD